MNWKQFSHYERNASFVKESRLIMPRVHPTCDKSEITTFNLRSQNSFICVEVSFEVVQKNEKSVVTKR